jgi:hypothetical protein
LPVSFISLRFERVDNLGAYRIPPETGILIPSGFNSYVPFTRPPDSIAELSGCSHRLRRRR